MSSFYRRGPPIPTRYGVVVVWKVVSCLGGVAEGGINDGGYGTNI